MSSSSQCDICEALQFSARATHTCIQCAKHMCNGCTGKHSSDRLLAHHQIVRTTPGDGAPLKCPDHTAETLKQYCVQCNRPVCVVCALYVHKDHERRGLRSHVDELRQHLDMLMEEAGLKQECGAQAQRDMEAIVSGLECELAQARDLLDDHHQALTLALDRKHAALQKRLTDKYQEKCQDVLKCRDELHQRMYKLVEFSETANKLSQSDARLIRLNQKFINNFSNALDVEPDNLDDLQRNAHLSFIPSYDINIGALSSSQPISDDLDLTAINKDHVFKDDLDTTTASLWSTTESSSLGFHDDHWQHSIGGDFEPLHSSSLGQWENFPPISPNRVSCSQSMNNLNTSEEFAWRTNFGQVSPIRELKPSPAMEPKLIYNISYKNVTSCDPIGIQTYDTVPIDVEFKNEHKLFVTQWGVNPKHSKNTSSLRYHQTKVGMVLYSFCCDQPSVVNSYDDSSPWCVTASRGVYYVTDLRNNSRTMRKYLEDGTLQDSWMEHIFNTPRGIATGGDVIAVTDTHHRVVYVCKKSADGHASIATTIGHVGTLRRYRSESNLSATPVSYSDTQFVNPLFVACNSSGQILISDAGDNTIKIYDNDGRCCFQFSETKPGDNLDTPMGICTDTIDNIYVADYGNNRVCKFNRHGQYLGDVVSAARGAVFNPRGVDVYGCYLAVSCHNEEREPEVKVFEIGQQLARETEKECDCQWLRLCQDE